MSSSYFQKVAELSEEGRSFASVIIVDTAGSVPQDPGAKMLVDEGGRLFGTVGGGKVEALAIKEAQTLLTQVRSSAPGENHGAKTGFYNWNLQKDVGMTCGGSVRLFIEVHNVTNWHIVVFGAGHCAAALIAIIAKLDCSVVIIDHRSEWLDKIPVAPRVKKVLVDSYLDYVNAIAPGTFTLLMTMGHTTDKPILIAILRRLAAKDLAPLPYLGVIGSKAKAHKLHQDIVDAGLDDNYPFFCPIGLSIGSNDPQEIAVSVAAQLIEQRDNYFSE
jgi:xanthine dehydrogenase accessory factor